MKLIALLMAILAMAPVALAEDTIQTNVDVEWEYTCLDSNTLYKNATIYSSNATNELNQTINCQHGCGVDIYGNAACKYSSFIRYIVVVAIVIFITLVGLIINRKI